MTRHSRPTRSGPFRILPMLPMLVVLLAGVLGLQASASRSHGPDRSGIDGLAPVEVLETGLRQPMGVAIDSSGAILVSDRGRGVVYAVGPDGTQARLTGLARPVGLAVDPAGRLLIVEEKTGRLLALDGSAVAVLARGMRTPRWVVTADDGTVYLTARGLRSDEGHRSRHGHRRRRRRGRRRAGPRGRGGPAADSPGASSRCGRTGSRGSRAWRSTRSRARRGSGTRAHPARSRWGVPDPGASGRLRRAGDPAVAVVRREARGSGDRPARGAVRECRPSRPAGDTPGCHREDPSGRDSDALRVSARGAPRDRAGRRGSPVRGGRHGPLGPAPPVPGARAAGRRRPAVTSQNPVVVTGQTEPSARVDVVLNDALPHHARGAGRQLRARGPAAAPRGERAGRLGHGPRGPRPHGGAGRG